MEWTWHQIWRSAIEIVLLSVGVYYVYIFIRGTRGAAVVTGFIVVLLALKLLSNLLQLEVLNFLLGTFSTFFLPVAILVLFQPELRRMLAEVGNLPLVNTTRQEREIVEVVVQTGERLSEVRIGALIAFERSVQLQEAVESGIVVDCEATPEMLETIFYPNNVVHDGGVILKGDRIAYAACIFPLSQRQDLHPSLGTRHRAAIGLSEETDAVVVVVSEETGSIAYAFKGQLVRGVTGEELRDFLTSVFVKRPRPMGMIQRLRERFQKRKQSSAVLQAKGSAR